MSHDTQGIFIQGRQIKVQSKISGFSSSEASSCSKTPKGRKAWKVKEDLTSHRFGCSTVIGFSHKDKDNRWHYLCRCDCGHEFVRSKQNMVSRSFCCKCNPYAKQTKHGKKNTSEYAIWNGMKYRCLNPSSPDYPRYGARGITVCERWMNFENFYKDMGKRPSIAYSLDRINNALGYSKSNCRWATKSEQQTNRKNSHIWVVRGLRFNSSAEAARYFKVTDTQISRLVHGYTDKRRGHTKAPAENCYKIPKYENS